MAKNNNLNKIKILNLITKLGVTTKVHLSKETKLTLPSVNTIVNELMEQKLVRENGKAESTGGKPATLISFDGRYYYVIGIDIGTTHLTFSLLNLNGEIQYKEIVPTPKNDTELTTKLVDIVRKILKNYTEKNMHILGIGVGVAGIVEQDTGTIILSPNMDYLTTNIKELLATTFNLPVEIENITKCMALTELNFDNKKKADNFLCINLGHGIGSALIINGQLYHGKEKNVNELGHTIILPHGPLCSCGNHGCLEAVSSSSAIIRNVKERLISEPSQLSYENSLNGKLIFNAAINGDPLAYEVTQEALYYLGLSIANMINFLDLEMIILEGGMTNSADYLLETLTPIIDKHQLKIGPSPLLKISDFGEDSGVIGAGCLIIEKVLQHASIYF